MFDSCSSVPYINEGKMMYLKVLSNRLHTFTQCCVIALLLTSESFFVGVGGDKAEIIDSSIKNTELATHPACIAEVSRLCGNKPEYFSDLDALECLLNQKREADELSEKCNHQAWVYRKSITENINLVASLDCVGHFKDKAKDCWINSSKETTLVNCIIDNKDKLTIETCRNLVTKLESVVFGDFELMGKFANACFSDIQDLNCGRNEVQNSKLKLLHSQGKTIECLSEKVQVLRDSCAVQLLRVAELQSTDFHLDRALYFSCRDDREKFCSRVTAGNGRVYKCLVKHKMEIEMSSDCRDQIYRRQKLGWQDYRTTGIVHSCKTEIKRFRCRRDAAATSDKNVRLSQILLCLETAHRQGNHLNGDCQDELRAHRKALMEDYRITPELLSACRTEQEKFCDKGVNGNTIHCLMGLAQSKNMEERISNGCRGRLEDLIKISDVASDWRVDPVLQQKCLPVVDRSSCSNLAPDQVLDCLMNLLINDNSQGLDADAMTDECEKTLLQIQYFISRVFPIDDELMKVCRKDAVRVCGVKNNWEPDSTKLEPNQEPLILSCLFRNIGSDGNSQISRPCAKKVRETMRKRAISVRLMPELEGPCLTNLADFCSDKTNPGEEINCLQDHLDELNRECKTAVSNFTEMEMKNPTTNPYLFKYCRDLIETKCSEDKSDDADLLECLIELKPEIKSKKCRATVEHLQILRVKDFNFTPKFKAQCHEFVVRNCKKTPKNNESLEKRITASSLVSCLSEIIRNDTLTDSPPRITKGCRKQVRNLILSKIQLESGQLDQKSVYSLCSESIRKLCGHVQRGQGRVLNCITQNKADIMANDPKCYGALFKIEEDVNNDPTLDLQLQKDCYSEIKLFCPGRTEDLVGCLLKASNQKTDFNEEVCGKTLRMRRIEQNSDVRLNPRLRKACGKDVLKFCRHVPAGNGSIMSCLKQVFVSSPKNQLSSTCKEHISDMIQGAAQKDIRIDSVLYISCKEDIEQTCKGTQDLDGDGGKAEECLKKIFHDDKTKLSFTCRDQVKQLIQSTLVDIHVDPILNQACAIDLVKRCDNVPPGEGRLIGCLLAILEEDKKTQKLSRLSGHCHDLLVLRSEMFQLAENKKLESIEDIYQGVQHSPHKNYFLTVGMSVVGCIFIFGLFCGRATKRRAEFKEA